MVKLSSLLKDRDIATNPVTAAWVKWRKKKWYAELGLHGADGLFHPSQIAGCPAMLFLYRVGFDLPPQDFEPRTCKVFDVGDSVHERIQCDLCRAGILDVSRFDNTFETPIYHPQYEIGGHCDGIVNFGPSTYTGKTFTMFGVECPIYEFSDPSQSHILEIKSINDRGFTDVCKKGAKPEHVWQASVYAFVLGIKNIVFLYENKNNQEWKEIVTPRSKKAWTEATAKIDMIREWEAEFKETGLIPRGVFQEAKRSAANRKPWDKVVALDLLQPPIGRKPLTMKKDTKPTPKKRRGSALKKGKKNAKK